MKNRTPALAYLRVSTKGQVDGDGFPRQRDAINHFAITAGYNLIGEYADEGVSGACELDDRPGLTSLLAHIASNGVRIVLVERADRLARDLMVGELILAECRKAGVRVIDSSGNDLSDDNDPTRVLIRQVLSAVAQFDKSTICAKLLAARIRMRRDTGRCEGRKPFGTRPGESDTLARLHTLGRKPRGGKRPSLARIAAALNAEGRPTRTGRPWSATVVGRLLERRP